MQLVLSSYLVLVALVLGSFINLAADRVPRGESIVRPRSHCRACGRVLNTIDLLPVLGYVVRGGKCASCKIPIGFVAPVVEAVCGALMLGAILWLGPWPGGAVALSLVVSLACAVTLLAVVRGAGDRISRPRGSQPDTGSAHELRSR